MFAFLSLVSHMRLKLPYGNQLNALNDKLYWHANCITDEVAPVVALFLLITTRRFFGSPTLSLCSLRAQRLQLNLSQMGRIHCSVVRQPLHDPRAGSCESDSGGSLTAWSFCSGNKKISEGGK